MKRKTLRYVTMGHFPYFEVFSHNSLIYRPNIAMLSIKCNITLYMSYNVLCSDTIQVRWKIYGL